MANITHLHVIKRVMALVLYERVFSGFVDSICSRPMSRVFALPNNVSNPGSHTDLRMEPSKHAESSNAAISAFYSLEFPSFTYYIQNLNVTIGRRCIAASPQSVVEVDVDLGPLKSVSRLHAKIDWEEDIEKFVLAVVGRNGAWVDGVWSGSGSKVPLTER